MTMLRVHVFAVLFIVIQTILFPLIENSVLYTGSSLTHLVLPHFLTAPFSLVRDIIPCSFINLLEPECTKFVKSTVVPVTSQAFTCTHHSSTDAPNATSSPATSIYTTVLTGVLQLIFITDFYCTFSMFRYVNTYPCVIITYRNQHSNKLYGFAAWEQHVVPYIQGVQQALPSRCA